MILLIAKPMPSTLKSGIVRSLQGASVPALRGCSWSLCLPPLCCLRHCFPGEAGLLIGIYLLLNAGYSLGLKHVVLVDIFIIAAGFMLRVLTGGYAIEVPISNWLVICTLFLSLFLGVAKRRSEINNLDRGASRKVLDDYTPELVRTIMIVSVAGSIMSYTLYTLSEHVIANFGTDKLIYTVPIVMFGMFRYLYLDEKKQTAENPVAVVARDPSLILTGLAWTGFSLLVIYLKL